MKKENLNLEGLEVEVVNASSVGDVNFSDLNWLKQAEPIFPEEFVSTKFKAEREGKVSFGIQAIKDIDPETPELFALLAKWWENKEARKTIKQAIDEYAVSKNMDPVFYMQSVLRKFAERFQGINDAVDRMLYITTYFKPRNGAVKDSFQVYMIDGEMYNVNLRVLSEMKEKISDNKKLLKEIKKVSEKVQVESL